MKAYLWDGVKQIAGELVINDEALTFELIDFKDTHLTLHIPKKEIKYIRQHRIFGVVENAGEVVSTDGRKNVFVVEDPQRIFIRISSGVWK